MNRAGEKPVRPHEVRTDPHGDYVGNDVLIIMRGM